MRLAQDAGSCACTYTKDAIICKTRRANLPPGSSQVAGRANWKIPTGKNPSNIEWMHGCDHSQCLAYALSICYNIIASIYCSFVRKRSGYDSFTAALFRACTVRGSGRNVCRASPRLGCAKLFGRHKPDCAHLVLGTRRRPALHHRRPTPLSRTYPKPLRPSPCRLYRQASEHDGT